MRPTRPQRLLAIDPTSRGFGFVVLEAKTKLVDWGVKETRRNKTEAALGKIRELVQLYQPDVLVTEDITDPRCRRRNRVRTLIGQIQKQAIQTDIKSRCVPIRTVRRVFGPLTKYEIARDIAAHFPELSRVLPPRRKPWMSENPRMAIFDAVALGLATFRSVQGRIRLKERV